MVAQSKEAKPTFFLSLSSQSASFCSPQQTQRSTLDQEELGHQHDILHQQHQQDLHIGQNQSLGVLCKKGSGANRENLNIIKWQNRMLKCLIAIRTLPTANLHKFNSLKWSPIVLLKDMIIKQALGCWPCFSFKVTWNSSRLGTSWQCIQTQLPWNLHYHKPLHKNSKYLIDAFMTLNHC